MIRRPDDRKARPAPSESVLSFRDRAAPNSKLEGINLQYVDYLPHRVIKPDKQSPRDYIVSDIHLIQAGDRRNRRQVSNIQTMPRVEQQTQFLRKKPSDLNAVELLVNLSPLGVRIGASMQFNVFRAYGLARLYLFTLGIDEHADLNAVRVERAYDIRQARQLRRHVEPAFRRNLLTFFGNQANYVRFDPMRDFDDFIIRAHFQIQPDVQHLAQQFYVAILDVPPILAKMDGDLMRSRHLAYLRRRYNVGPYTLARLAQSRHMIDIHAQFNHQNRPYFICRDIGALEPDSRRKPYLPFPRGVRGITILILS
jgi:hypothetical protein